MLPKIEQKTLMQKTARVLYYLTIGCIVLAAALLLPKIGLALFGSLFAAADAAGAPNSTGFAFLDIIPFAAYFLWLGNAPLLELLGILLVSFGITHVLYKKKWYAATAAVAIVFLLVAAPFARAAIYFTASGAMLPTSISGVDSLTYRTLSTDPHVEGRFSLDKNHVYCGSQILPDVDPKSFSMIAGQDATGEYAKDSQSVWWGCTKITNADPSSFIMVSVNKQADTAWAAAFARDSRAVYFQGVVILDADPGSFIILTDDYAKDKTHVFVGTRIIPGADPATFQTLTNFSHCYVNQDPNCPPDAKDATHTYLHGQVLGKVN